MWMYCSDFMSVYKSPRELYQKYQFLVLSPRLIKPGYLGVGPRL